MRREEHQEGGKEEGGHRAEPHREVPRCAVAVSQDFDPLIALGHAEEVALDVGLALSTPGGHTDTHKKMYFNKIFYY